jgi:hypothetical protein
MDLRLIARVVWRFRLLLAAGVVLAVLLAAASVWRVAIVDGSPTLAHRQEVTWVSYGRLLVTQVGFPQGRTDLGDAVRDVPLGGDAAATGPSQQFAAPGRFVEMARLYARLGTTEAVRQLVFEKGPIEGAQEIDVSALQELPLIEIAALATSRKAAITLAQRQADALRVFIAREQRSAGIAPANRIGVELVERPGAPATLAAQANTWIISGRSMMQPGLIFLTVCGLFFALAMVLENMNPRLRIIAAEVSVADPEQPEQPVVRSA